MRKHRKHRVKRDERKDHVKHHQPQSGRGHEGRITDAYNRARYGADSKSALFWVLEKLHANDGETYRCLAAKRIRISEVEQDYINALVAQWKREQLVDGRAIEFELLSPALFFDWATIAIRKRDYKFFEKVARLLRDKVVPLQEDSVGRHVINAYTEVKEPGGEPTKKKVRETALRNWATHRLLVRAVKKTGKPWNGDMPTERAILEEQENLPRQDWTEVFQRVGLADLPSDKGGRPSQKRFRPRW